MQHGTERTVQCLERAQQRQKGYADKGRRDVTCDVGEQLLLNTKMCDGSTLAPLN